MKAKTLKIIVAASSLLLAAVIIWFAISIKLCYDRNSLASKEHFSTISRRALSVFDSEAMHKSELLHFIGSGARSSDRLQLFAVFDRSGKLFYLYADDASLAPRERIKAPYSQLGSADFTREKLSLNRSLLFHETLSMNGTPFSFQAFYRPLDRSDVRSLLFPVIPLALAFSLFILFFIIRGNGSKTVLQSSPHLDETDRQNCEDSNGEGAAAMLYSPLSGLGWEAFLPDRLDNELKRSASFEQELSFAIISGEGFIDNDCYRSLGESISRVFPLKDLIFEYNTDFGRGFALILPNTPLYESIAQLKEFFNDQDECSVRQDLTLHAGLSSRSGRLIDGELLIKEAGVALRRARHSEESKIIGFKPDPGKYRSFLAKKEAPDS